MARGFKLSLVLSIALPISIAAATALAQEPHAVPPAAEFGEPEDNHTRPAPFDAPLLPDALAPQPAAVATTPEYPLAVAFNPADPSNYTADGIESWDYIVVHTMQGYYESSQSWFQNPAANVSAHFMMRSDDGEVTQMVALKDRAWHVKASNRYAIGIEHEGFIDEPAWYTWATYSSSARLARWIADELGIPLNRERILGHVELPNQTNIDPGDNWDWDLYMALIQDGVSGGTIEGWALDASQECTITALVDTWIKSTLEEADELGDMDKCFLPAGTELSYLHASAPMVGHLRLDYPAPGNPCEGFIGLDTQGYVFSEHFSPACGAQDMAAAGVAVRLDGGLEVVSDASGYFVFEAVSEGPHSLDFIGGSAYEDYLEPVDPDVYPGLRVVVSLEPLNDPGDGDDDGGGDGSDDGGECLIGALGCACTMGGGCDPGLSCELELCVPSEDEGGGTGDGGIDYLEGESCSVSAAPPSTPLGLAMLALLGLGFGLRRRRSLAA